MIYTIDALKTKDSITTGEALLTIAGVCRKYNQVLDKIISIREQTPELTGEAFRRQSSNIERLHQVNAALLKIQQIVNEQARQITITYEAGLENYDCPNVNQMIISQLTEIVTDLTQLYADKARSFSLILNEFELLTTLLINKLDRDTVEAGYIARTSLIPSEQQKGHTALHTNVPDYAYVRLFHRNMEQLLSPNATINWMRPLLESVKNAEKHGLAVYADEEYARKSLRSPNYGYLTIHLRPEQDITAQRPLRRDESLNCPLLTIQHITTEDFIKFSFAGYDFPICNGILHRPKGFTEGK